MVTQAITIEPEDGDDDEEQGSDYAGAQHECSLYAALTADEHASAGDVEAAVERLRWGREWGCRSTRFHELPPADVGTACARDEAD